MTDVKLANVVAALALCGAILTIGAPVEARIAANGMSLNGKSLNDAAFGLRPVTVSGLTLPDGTVLNAR